MDLGMADDPAGGGHGPRPVRRGGGGAGHRVSPRRFAHRHGRALYLATVGLVVVGLLVEIIWNWS
jgi:hypothetical protein